MMQHAASWARLALLDCLRGAPTACPSWQQAPWLSHALLRQGSACHITTATTSQAAQPTTPTTSQAAEPSNPPTSPSTTQEPSTAASSSQGSAAAPADTATPTAAGTSRQESTSGQSAAAGSMAFGTRQVLRKLRGQETLQGIVHINNTLNNILMVLSDPQGNVKISLSAGNVGFRNARKSQPAAAEKTAEAIAQGALKLGYGSVVVKMKGVGMHKQLAVQMLHTCGLRITELQDITPVAYNGCRLPKRRRI